MNEFRKDTPSAATQVPHGSFAINIDELRRQLRDSQVQVGPDGLIPNGQDGHDNQGHQPDPSLTSAIKVPKGTFHVRLD